MSYHLKAGLLIALCWLAGAARADEPRAPLGPVAKAHYDRGLAHYLVKEYAAAIPELQAAYAAEPRSDILFALAQAERLIGDCRTAIVLYRKLIATTASAREREGAEVNLANCRAQLAAASPAPPAETTTAPAPPAETTTTTTSAAAAPSPAPARAWYRDPIGGVLGGLGVGALVAGIAVAAVSASDEGRASRATTYQQYGDELGRARSERTAGVVMVSLGAALVVGAAVRYALVRRARSERMTRAAVAGDTGAWAWAW